MAYLRLTIPGMAPAQRAELVSGMRLGLSDEEFAGMLGATRLLLAEGDWSALLAALGSRPSAGGML